VTCTPPSGSFFAKGVTTVTCSSTGVAAPTGFPVGTAGSGATASVAISGPTPGQPAKSVQLKSVGQIGFPASPFDLLYDQTSNPGTAATGSQNFEAANDIFDDAVADDFVVPAGQQWTVNQVNVSGLYFNGAGPAASVNVVFYSDSATLPGAVVATRNNQTMTDTAGNFAINVSPAVVLSAGTYWVSVQANMNFTPNGQWGWIDRTTISNSGAAWINPGGGFGTACTPNFGRKTTCVPTSSPDNIFQILGTSGAVGGGGPTCTFTVTVNDTQPPSITCPANVTAAPSQAICPSPPCQVVSYPAPIVSDNCPGVTVACVPPAGSCFATGTTSVTCTATDTSGNTATCSFTVSVFDVVLQDDSSPSTLLVWNSLTGQYRLCCNGTIFTGTGKATRQGCIYALNVNSVDRRLVATADKGAFRGSAVFDFPIGTQRCTITDRDIRNDTGVCQ
jgi:hypothetical protein